VEKWKGIPTYYGESFRLPLNEPDGNIVGGRGGQGSQSLDNTPTGGDPVMAARRLGGIVNSANISETGECACEILFDTTFDVATVVLY
jgi:hypothetical protein